jgi:amino acid adenylation domain-containing protein
LPTLSNTEFVTQSVGVRPEDQCLHEIFTQVARSNADNDAVLFEGRRLSYRALNEQANRVAAGLAVLGAGPEKLVGVAVPRSLELVPVLLGILKSGAAYLPLDPESPGERRALVLEEAQPFVIVATGATKSIVPAEYQCVLAEDLIRDESGSVRQGDGGSTSPLNLIYVIYTSGSTGKPKGAMLTHQGVMNRLFWGIREYGLGPGARVLQKSPLTFDVSVWEIFAPLLCGAATILTKPNGHRDPRYLLDLISTLQVTDADFVPSLLRVFLEQLTPHACDSLLRVTCAGEALTPDLYTRAGELLKAQIYNLYGPTETSLAVTYWAAPRGKPVLKSVPIGRPMTHATIYILGTSLDRIPVGRTGELYIAGVAVGRGYLKRPDLTAECFVADPYSEVPGSRMYRTGDLARLRPDGEIEFLGRVDEQVKVRGFRIELGEIEAALLQHPSVQAAAITARHDSNGNNALVAYVQLAEGLTLNIDELRTFMLKLVPDYMVPSGLVMLDSMPLNQNGKVDKRQLPKHIFGTNKGVATNGEPSDEIEKQLASIWKELLQVERIGTQDKFLDLGGHSLKSIELISIVEKRFGLEMDASDLRLPELTVARLATVLRPQLEARQGSTSSTS